jgi:hypothetical protein
MRGSIGDGNHFANGRGYLYQPGICPTSCWTNSPSAKKGSAIMPTKNTRRNRGKGQWRLRRQGNKLLPIPQERMKLRTCLRSSQMNARSLYQLRVRALIIVRRWMLSCLDPLASHIHREQIVEQPTFLIVSGLLRNWALRPLFYAYADLRRETNATDWELARAICG